MSTIKIPSGMAKIIVISVFVIVIILAIFSILRLTFIFLVYADIANWISLNLNINDPYSTILSISITSLMIPLVPYFLWYFAIGRYKVEVFLITVIISLITAFLLYKFGQDVYFDPRTKAPLRYYASTPNGVIFSRSPGFDKKFGTEFKPVIPQIIASLEKQKSGITPKKINIELYDDKLSGLEFFDPVNGSAKVYYFILPTGEIELFDNAGFHPQYREPLQEINQEIIDKLKNTIKSEIQSGKKLDGFIIKDNIVIDTKKKLMWLRCPVGQEWNGKTCIGDILKYIHKDAFRISRELSEKYRFGGFSDWRLPSKEELSSLVRLEELNTKKLDKSYQAAAINQDIFPMTLVDKRGGINFDHYCYWSSDYYTGIFDDDIYVLCYNDGNIRDVYDKNFMNRIEYPIRLVRKIQKD